MHRFALSDRHPALPRFFSVRRHHGTHDPACPPPRSGGQLEEAAVLRWQRGPEHPVPGARRGAGGVALGALIQRLFVGDAQLYAPRFVILCMMFVSLTLYGTAK